MRPLLALTLILTPALAHAGGYGQMISGSAQAGLATPQAALVPQAAPSFSYGAALEAPAEEDVVVERTYTEYVPRTVVRREIVSRAPAPSYSTGGCYGAAAAPLRSFAPGGCYSAGAALRQRSFAPVAYSAPVAAASATVNYGNGVGAGFAPARGLFGLNRAAAAQPTKSKAVVKTGRGLFRRR